MTGAAAAAAIKVRRFIKLSFVFESTGRTRFVTLNRAWKAETGWKWFVFRFRNRTNGKVSILHSPVSVGWVTVAAL
jgi:hypothetical protein